MIDQSLQYYNGDLLGFIPQPKRQERDRTTTRSMIAFLVRMERAITLQTQ